MKFKLFSQVALCEDMPEFNLIKGSVGTIVECYPASENQEAGYSLEGLIPQDTIEVSESQIEAIPTTVPPIYTAR